MGIIYPVIDLEKMISSIKEMLTERLSPAAYPDMLNTTDQCQKDVMNDENISNGVVKARCWSNFIGFISQPCYERSLRKTVSEWDRSMREATDQEEIREAFMGLIHGYCLLLRPDYSSYSFANAEDAPSGIKSIASMVINAVGMNAFLNDKSTIALVNNALIVHLVRYIHLRYPESFDLSHKLDELVIDSRLVCRLNDLFSTLDIFAYLPLPLAKLPWIDPVPCQLKTMDRDLLNLFEEYREYILTQFTSANETTDLHDTMICWINATVICSQMYQLVISEDISVNDLARLLLTVLLSGRKLKLTSIMRQLALCKLYGIEEILLAVGVIEEEKDTVEILTELVSEAVKLLESERELEEYILGCTGLINQI